MHRLTLWRIGPEAEAFLQYIPGNFRPLLGRDDTVCVGAAYGGAACGAALAQREPSGDSYCLRYIFIDPAARLCGLGTYLLRGLLGQLHALGAREVSAVYAPSMLEPGKPTLGILERAGFSRPKPVATSFSTRLGDIPDVDVPPSLEMALYSVADAPEAVWEAYQALLTAGAQAGSGGEPMAIAPLSGASAPAQCKAGERKPENQQAAAALPARPAGPAPMPLPARPDRRAPRPLPPIPPSPYLGMRRMFNEERIATEQAEDANFSGSMMSMFNKEGAELNDYMPRSPLPPIEGYLNGFAEFPDLELTPRVTATGALPPVRPWEERQADTSISAQHIQITDDDVIRGEPAEPAKRRHRWHHSK